MDFQGRTGTLVYDEFFPSFSPAAAAPATVAAPPRAVVATRVRAADNHSADTAENARYWRRLGQERTRNLTDFDHREMVRLCSRSAQADGIGRAHVRLVTSATVGALEIEPLVRCENIEAAKRLQELLHDVWTAPGNDLACALPEFMDGLTTTGSLCLTAHVGRDAQGAGSQYTTLGYVDPESFVAPGVLTDPGNVRSPIAVLRSSWQNDEIVAHPILRPDDTVHPMFASSKEGSKVAVKRSVRFGGAIDVTVGAPCFYLGVNRVSPSQTVGISDIYPVLDTLGLLDELVFGSVQRSINIGAYSLHVKFPSGTLQADMDERMAAIRADLESGEGRAVGTTDDVTIQAVLANLQAGEWATIERMARTNALIGLGPWPIHVFSDGGGTNVATAAEQGSPVANFLLSRQNSFRKLMIRIAWYMLRQFPEAIGLIEANPDVQIELPLPTIVARDTTRESNTLSTEVNILLASADQVGLRIEALQREWRESANRYGMHFAPEDFKDEDEMDEERTLRGLPMPGLDQPPPKKMNEGTGERVQEDDGDESMDEAA